jgi:hypothetical protein
LAEVAPSSYSPTQTCRVILVIFGAGASYDAIPAYAPHIRGHEYRLPLSDHLFDLDYADELEGLPYIDLV